MGKSPYPESAGINPASRYAQMSEPLHEYGSWITSGTYAGPGTARD